MARHQGAFVHFCQFHPLHLDGYLGLLGREFVNLSGPHLIGGRCCGGGGGGRRRTYGPADIVIAKDDSKNYHYHHDESERQATAGFLLCSLIPRVKMHR